MVYCIRHPTHQLEVLFTKKTMRDILGGTVGRVIVKPEWSLVFYGTEVCVHVLRRVVRVACCEQYLPSHVCQCCVCH